MANKPLPFKKRSNPMENEIQKTIEKTTVAPEKIEQDPPFFTQKVENPEPKPVKAVKPAKGSGEIREKYTATMNVNLRRRLKIAAATYGLQISDYIEEACREKLDREGR